MRPVCLVPCIISIICSIIISVFVYRQTQESSRIVGFGAGSIDAKSNLIKTIRNIADKVYDCREVENKYKLILISKTETDSLYLFKSENGHDEFCQYMRSNW